MRLDGSCNAMSMLPVYLISNRLGSFRKTVSLYMYGMKPGWEKKCFVFKILPFGYFFNYEYQSYTFLHQVTNNNDLVLPLHRRMYEALYTRCFLSVFEKLHRQLSVIQTHDLLLSSRLGQFRRVPDSTQFQIEYRNHGSTLLKNRVPQLQIPDSQSHSSGKIPDSEHQYWLQ